MLVTFARKSLFGRPYTHDQNLELRVFWWWRMPEILPFFRRTQI